MFLRIFAITSVLFSLFGFRSARTARFNPGPGFNGTGVYNSSATPSNLPWNTYNYCNAPHVNAEHYTLPADAGAELVYLNGMMRHHKRTPDNLYPDENALNPAAGWDCADFVQDNYAGGGARVNHRTETPTEHPLLRLIWNGTCDGGQLTRGGFEDAVRHGRDMWSVYHDRLGFLTRVDPEEIYIRTSPSDRTMQVTSGLLFGMDPATVARDWTVAVEPSVIDSLVPSYACPGADAIRAAYQSVPAWTDHLEQAADLKARLDATLGMAGLDEWSSWYDHFFDTFTSRTCHGHPLPCNATGACVAEEDAEIVHALGDFEYNYIWNTAENASTYVRLTFGVMFGELAQNFEAFRAGDERRKFRLYVGHDGSLVRLAKGLGFGEDAPLRWPALGSEVMMEVWKTTDGEKYVRVTHEGTPVSSLAWVPLDEFIGILGAQVPEGIFEACTGGT